LLKHQFYFETPVRCWEDFERKSYTVCAELLYTLYTLYIIVLILIRQRSVPTGKNSRKAV